MVEVTSKHRMNSANDRTLVVVSHYMARPKDDLQALLSQLQVVTSDVLVVINDDAHHGPAEWVKNMPVSCLKRENTGMNIGGWNEGYKQKPDFDHYIFLQDECMVKDNAFLEAYVDRLANPEIGLIGECLNPRWNVPWDVIANNSLFNFPIQITSNAPPIMSINFYKYCLSSWGVAEGPTGKHLRALVWAISKVNLKKIENFPLGRIHQECIAAEIAVSKKIEQLSLCVEQCSNLPFKFIEHKEWRIDGSKKKQFS